MNSVASNYLSLKYQKSTTSGSIDIGIRKFEIVAKTQFLCTYIGNLEKTGIGSLIQTFSL